MRIKAALALAVLLAGCGGGKTDSAATGTGIPVESAPDAKRVAIGPVTGTGSNDCSTKPDFAPVYPGAKITICSAGHIDATGKDGGSVIYTTDAAPDVVLAWVKDQNVKAGLKPGMALPSMISAMDGTDRTTMTHVTPAGSGSKVVVNWGRKTGA
jgi:hypothetical protein